MRQASTELESGIPVYLANSSAALLVTAHGAFDWKATAMRPIMSRMYSWRSEGIHGEGLVSVSRSAQSTLICLDWFSEDPMHLLGRRRHLSLYIHYIIDKIHE